MRPTSPQNRAISPKARALLAALGRLSTLAQQPRYRSLVLEEYPFDAELIARSRLYRHSRAAYLALGGVFLPRNQSTLRSLSAADLFDDQISFAPMRSEAVWLASHLHELTPEQINAEAEALLYFNDLSLYHEQNHRVLWRLLPPAPRDERGVCRYLNFAESVVVLLDVAAAEDVGALARDFHRLNLLYRVGSRDRRGRSKAEQRRYLLAVFYATYCLLERVDRNDVRKALTYVMPDQPRLNREAVRCALEMNPDFAAKTSPRWQLHHWRTARTRLSALHRGSAVPPLVLPGDPLDLGPQLALVTRVMATCGL